MTVLRAATDPDGVVSVDLECVTNSSPAVTYRIRWREQVVAGTAGAPTRVVAREDLVQPPKVFGIVVISTLSDSIVLEAVDGNTTRITAIRHVAAVRSDPLRTAQFLTDLYRRVVARAHARPAYS